MLDNLNIFNYACLLEAKAKPKLMSRKFWAYCLSLMLLSSLMLNCGGTPSIFSAPTVTLTSIPNTLSPTVKPLSSPTLLSLTETPQPTFTSIPPTRTPTLVATLTASEREAYTLELLKTNANCMLPCWWGVIPGQTSWAEAEYFLKYLGARTSTITDSTGIIFHGTGGFDFGGVYNGVGFYESKGTVASVVINAETNDPAALKSMWEAFSPEQVVLRYGMPSRVWVYSEAEFTELPYPSDMEYHMWFVYSKLGFLVEYVGSVPYETTYRMCPTFAEEGNLGKAIKMRLKPPEEGELLEEEAKLASTSTLEEASGLSLEEFVALFEQDEKPVCFETARDFWR